MSAETRPILLQIGQQEVSAADVAALSAAITAQNGRARIASLPDELNPDIIDPAKASAFAAGLAHQPADTLQKLQGRTLLVSGRDLGIAAADPTRADAFAGPFPLAIDDVQGSNVLAHSGVAVDPGLAKSRAAEAQARLHDAEAEVTKAEAAHEGGAAYGDKLRRRAAVAMAWRINARAWAKSAPADPQAAASREAADKAALAYMRPSGGML